MYCSKCGKDITNLKYCPNCEREKEVNYKASFKVMFTLSIVSLLLSLIPLSYMIMGMGILIGIVSLIGIILVMKDYKESNKVKIALVFSISGILCNIVWILFSYYILPL